MHSYASLELTEILIKTSIDVPSIVSGDKLAYLDPQETIWEGKSGRLFELSEVLGTDNLSPFHGIADFNRENTSYYPKTLFRFPLRTAASNLSDNVYTPVKVIELLKALKAEAKLLLTFLRSVTSIEVYRIDNYGKSTLLFQTKVADEFLTELTQKRKGLMQKVRESHGREGYNCSTIHADITRFDVSINYNSSITTTRWLVANQVGSSIPDVLRASMKQKVFPWVGTALELDCVGDGRIFCFLPMPIDVPSNIPVHINGTFGLNDDRRSLKWPVIERQNDPTAQWNDLLVKHVIPSCYLSLLLEVKKLMNGGSFYEAWPVMENLESSHWVGLLKPLFKELLMKNVVWSEAVGQRGEWVMPTSTIYVPQSVSKLEATVEKTLTSCGVKVAKVPDCVRSSFLLADVKVKDVSPQLVRYFMRKTISSYRNIGSEGKIELLKYCLSDAGYHDLDQLELLPLANGSFVSFQRPQLFISSSVYLCTKECPRNILPNLDHKLVDLSNDSDLHKSLVNVASTNQTQLQCLSVNHVASLVDDTMPVQWSNQKIVHFPCNERFPSQWFKMFWEWVSNKNLSLFSNKLVVPVQKLGVFAPGQFSVIRLAPSQSVLYVPSHQAIAHEMMSLLTKYEVRYCQQSVFPFVSHHGLSSYIINYSPDNILGAIAKNIQHGVVELTLQEAETLGIVLMQACYLDLRVLRNIKMFITSLNTQEKLFSVSDVCKMSVLKQGVVEPSNLKQLISVLPHKMVIFANKSPIQLQLLEKLGIYMQTQAKFIMDFIFPRIQNGAINDNSIDSIMICVLDDYHIICSQIYSMVDKIKNLRFVKNGLGQRKCPHELFNPSNEAIYLMFKGEKVFPAEPYNTSSYIKILQNCGLRDSVTAQEILNIIFSISVYASSSPLLVSEVKIARAKAIINYIQMPNFKNKKAGSFNIDESINRSYLPFDTALLLLSENRSWFPVQANCPYNYPSCLSWKGSGSISHFVSLSNTTAISCSSNQTFTLLYGSQAYFTEPSMDGEVFEWLGSHQPTSCLLPHFREVILHKDNIPADNLLNLVSKIYSAMQELLLKKETDHINALQNMKEWVYIRKYGIFVDIKAVAEKENLSFRHNIEPYLHILPDSISRYSTLFSYFGMRKSISQDQIVSILGAMKDQISSQCAFPSSDLMWGTLMAILNWLTNNGTQDSSIDSILVPAESDSEWPDLRDAQQLVYTDNDFLKSFTSSSEDEPELTFVHSCISPSLAKCLNITPLSEELDVSEDTFSDAGQCEPLTVRLKNILKDYKDGVTIVKELIQNADDAEASEINICFDARNHKLEKRTLLFPGMQESHGPALVVHNNSTFSDEDFDNIQKLAAATKQVKKLKIGKFGIGFCSVYHITDVPSFISRNRMYIFDPTLQYLCKEVKNPTQPGKMVKFLSRLIKNSCQLWPYKGLFGFSSSTEFDGTIFRLPFRKIPGEISGTCYTKGHVNQLFDDIKQCGDKLLLFLQHVKKITIQQIEDGQNHPTLLYELSKCISAPLHCDQPYLTSKISIQTKDQTGSTTTCTDWLVADTNISSRCTSEGHWVIDSQSPSHSHSKEAVANVACLLSSSSGKSDVYTLNCDLNGEMFCFLPLSQTTGLPVHISCNFAVINNRRGIWTSLKASSCTDDEVQWNIHLMTNVIPIAYKDLLYSLRDMQASGHLTNYQYYSIWPLDNMLEIKILWEEFVTAFYNSLTGEKMFFSESKSCWLRMGDGIFLEDHILCNSGVLSCVINVVNHLKLPLVHLPTSYQYKLSLKNEILTEEKFVNLFFNNLTYLSDQDVMPSRDDIIFHMLEAYTCQKDTEPHLIGQLTECFDSFACIPCRPQGKILNNCRDLIDPSSPFFDLFDESENRFPIDCLVSNVITIEALKEVGMVNDHLPWKIVLERAQTVSALMQTNKLKALKRVRLLLTTLTKHISEEPPTTGPRIHLIPFLPVLKKPEDYPLVWHGEGHQLLCGQDLVISDVRSHLSVKNTLIAGSQVSFVCDSMPVNEKVQDFLHIQSTPSCSEVIAHLKLLVDQMCDTTDKEWVTMSCRMIYDFLDTALKYKKTIDIKKLKEFSCIWNQHQFLSINFVAEHWKMKKGPYLYSIPDILVDKKYLTKALNIKEYFTHEDAKIALQMMNNAFNDKPVSEICKRLIKDLIPIFSTAVDQDDLCEEFVNSDLYLPDEHVILQLSTKLAYNDAGWATKVEGCNYIHKDIPRCLAEALGVRLVRSKMLDKFISHKTFFPGTEFGQCEDLTQRIQNIIRDYPLDITILKELLQNADDARAKKMYFILDKRTHGDDSLISENWQKLQGPALLVWNNSTFLEKDLQGIQELGLGSKRREAETIGQYGIGFNVVYHLTDCPSFITGGETLCIMDPHCQYADGATKLSPGRRYDKLNEGFWKSFSDMSSSYLKEGLNNIPGELQGGSLFRFPIRHSQELVNASKILVPQDPRTSQPLTTELLSAKLEEWMPKMKSAMFFLNNVTEIKYIVIEPDSTTLKTVHHFQTRFPEPSKFERQIDTLKDTISNFREVTNCKTYRALYPLVITEFNSDQTKELQEEWLVQQGIGDLKDESKVWQYVWTVKPRHGIAAPRKVRQSSDQGQIFCFLPLPVKSEVPVHINGSFMMNSTRRNLWSATNPDEIDDKSKWNANLFQAISSSYADFLVSGKHYYLNQSYATWKTAYDDLLNFYQLFPHLKKNRFRLFQNVFKALVQDNSTILCVFVYQNVHGSRITTQWYPLISENKSDQVHFWSRTSNVKIIHPVLKSLGMKISSAPERLRVVLNSFITKDSPDSPHIPAISSASVFEYYTQHSCFSSRNGMTSCPLSDTVFHDIKSFTVFLRHLLNIPQEEAPIHKVDSDRNVRSSIQHYESASSKFLSSCSHSENPVSTGEFPESPFSHFLLLSADGILKTFDEDLKCFSSDFSHIFPANHRDKFLHPDLREMKLHSSYFISAYDTEEDNANIIKLLLDIFRDTFPPKMFSNSAIEQATTLISKQELLKYWECFAKDEVFTSFVPCFLEKVALLLTLDDRLFSTSSAMLPLYLPSRDNCLSGIKDVVNIMRKVKMPFLDTSVVTVRVHCPTLTDHAKVLTNLVHIHKATSLTSVLNNKEIDMLILYFASNLILKDSLDNMQSLPFFEDITGIYQTINTGDAYIWPNSCMVGYQSWLAAHNSTIFLKPHSEWKCLGSAECLSIHSISEMELYNQFIFPHFGRMNEDDRYEHLKYIRERLFYSVKSHRKFSFTKEDKCSADLFHSNLLSLKCIGASNSALQPISSFCNHRKIIFTVFYKKFQVLPERLQSDDWLTFFKELDLKQNLTEEEYLMLCQETADNFLFSKKKSDVLLEYLFSKEVLEIWCEKKAFLSQISRIPFVFASEASIVSWVTPHILQQNKLVQLKGSAPVHLQHLVWTVRPLISLPKQCTYEFMFLNSMVRTMLSSLGVIIQPDIADVVNNITNISNNSRYTNVKLFSNYSKDLFPPCTATGDVVSSLVDILNKNLTFLSNHLERSSEYETISSLSCIPVYAEIDKKDKKKVVLVEPRCVLISESCTQFQPFLHTLPTELSPLSTFLKSIGMDFGINLCHLRIVMEEAFKNSEGLPLDPNTQQCVKCAIVNITKLMNVPNTSDDSAKYLTPLYLPDTENVLKLSTSLLYGDTPSYSVCIKVDLTGTTYSHFDILQEDYDGFSALDVCRLLPLQVRPLRMSKNCKQLPNEECYPTDSSETALKLEKSFEDESNALAIVKFLDRFVAKQNHEENLKEHIGCILSYIRVLTIPNLEANIVLNDSEKVIGRIKCDYFFHFSDLENCLYIDSDTEDSSDITSELAEYILESISSYIEGDLTTNKESILKFIGDYLKCNPSKKHSLLEKYRIHVSTDGGTKTLDLRELGVEIPPIYHNRLDQDPNNIFNPMEFVGYEIVENKIIVAQVVHLVPSEEETNLFSRKFIIYVSSDDEQGKEVNALQLYKFLIGKKSSVIAEDTQDDSRALLLHDGGDEVVNLRASLHQFSSIEKKRFICQQLNEIWKLGPELKRKALKRLFLNYHPDKNVDKPDEFEMLFLFLKAQIAHLDNGEPLDEPGVVYSDASGAQSFNSQNISRKFDFDQWNATAEIHRRHAHSGGHAYHSSSPFDKDVNFKNPAEGRRWLRQACIDFGVLLTNFSHASDNNGYAHVCFMAHQVAEKALKGAVYALCGPDARTLVDHNLSRNALALQTVKPKETYDLPLHCSPLECHYLNTRYPNRWPGYTDAPSDHYDQEEAETAKNHADKVLRVVQLIMP